MLLHILRLSGRSGSALPGLVVEKISPNYVKKMAKRLPGGVVLVTGTNGKTTTTKLLAGVLEANKASVLVNRSGSNMSRGIAAAFIEQSSWLAGVKDDVGLFEVDEAFVGEVSAKTKPRVLVVLNLLRDQLDRYGELDRTASLIAKGIEHSKLVILNNDDSLVKNLAKKSRKTNVKFFGAVPKLQQSVPDDASLLIKATQGIERFLPDFRHLDVLLTKAKSIKSGQNIALKYRGESYDAYLQLPGLYNAYNAAAAALAAASLDIPFSKITSALAGVKPAFGRSEVINSEGKKLELLLVKNPSGFNQIINTFLSDHKNLLVLFAINDNFADGRDVSWLWDVDFEKLKGMDHNILVSGIRAHDLAVRLKYAEITCSVEPNLQEALKAFRAGIKDSQVGYVVPTYTAMLGLRLVLSKEDDVKEIWK